MSTTRSADLSLSPAPLRGMPPAPIRPGTMPTPAANMFSWTQRAERAARRTRREKTRPKRSLSDPTTSQSRPRTDATFRNGRATRICRVSQWILTRPSPRSVAQEVGVTGRGLLYTRKPKTPMDLARNPVQSRLTAPFCPLLPSSSTQGSAIEPTQMPGQTRVGGPVAAHPRGGMPRSRCPTGRSRTIRPGTRKAPPFTNGLRPPQTGHCPSSNRAVAIPKIS